MLIDGINKSFLRIDSLPYDDNNGIYLTYLKNDSLGMKMTGDLPVLWKKSDDKITGPNLYDENYTYQVINIDYQNKYIWLEQI